MLGNIGEDEEEGDGAVIDVAEVGDVGVVRMDVLPVDC